MMKKFGKITPLCARVSPAAYFSSRPFKILGLQQVAIGSTDKQKLTEFWVDTLGIKKIGSFKSERENVDEDILEMGNAPHAVEIDLMSPLDETKSPKVHIPALNHIGLWVDDLPKCVEYLEGKGLRIVGGIRKGAGGHDVTFVHPKSAQGILLELVQAPEDVIKAHEDDE
mmetsp:Transcript_7882/g.8556  ORF Transcript_7882/g.8556 Transcript_7882/m.8556 type:complete len:170 (-) Transcript_7882:168-677(-)|eukprot:CAMPEP_0115026930 /NCGR_PEP_ID=MMETSP0216-20121206/35105_1 /TAXON_ID=223996 /ORGANISM="Protocruzia adherens, Strain Boccale" /LENGTH=169 /DNA_ID=CAMNT_0002402231 /DNA_START=65 /DNA_END=574 /DNA_ORIENTATION=+